jgi:glycosyltransferase involved in cell wall biosynthesis
LSSRRITFVAQEVRGSYPAGGLGTATTFLALALARLGHEVDVLRIGFRSSDEVEPEWAAMYERAGVRVRFLPRGEGAVGPSYLVRAAEVERALRADPPDVVITQDTAAPAYSALRSRALGLGFERTLFVVFCHGTTGWIKLANRNLRFFPGTLAGMLLEQGSVELADAVVSPSAYLVDWMRGRGWRLPEQTHVIPYVTRSGAAGERPPSAPPASANARVDRVAFFGRLEERKGIRPFVGALNALEPELLGRIEVEFVGGELPLTAERVRALFSERTAAALRGVAFETSLDQHEAIARLRRPGTLVVMPSLDDNSPNTVYECLEHGIPFLTGNVGGAGELVAEEDRARVLCEPSVGALVEALRRALADPETALRPARAAFDDAESLRRWQEVLALPPRRPSEAHERLPVEVVVVHHGSQAALSRCLAALAAQVDAEPRVSVVVAGRDLPDPASLPAGVRLLRTERTDVEGARRAALSTLVGEWVLFLDEDDLPEPELVRTLARAQQASGADVVSCGVYLRDESGGRSVHLFPGEPRALGLIANGYGTVALIRRALLDDRPSLWPMENDPNWPLLARLSAAGAKIVSVPTPLVTGGTAPGSLERSPSDALLVVEELEHVLPAQLASAGRLAAGLASDASRAPSAPAGLAQRIGKAIQVHGVRGTVRRAVVRVLPTNR